MSRQVVRLNDGTKYIADLDKDTKLYNSPSNPPNTGTKYTSGNDLYVHKTKNHGFQYYKYYWSMWQGDESGIIPISKDEAIQFLEEHTNDYYGFPDDSDIELLKEYGIDLMEETA